MKKIALFVISIIIIACFAGCINFGTDVPTENKTDSDGDGVFDSTDDFPSDNSASKDSDGDGYPDDWNPGKNESDSTTNLSIDDFPYDPAASIDTDGDGYPDHWNSGKNQGDSTSIPPLEIDEYPDDPNAHKDTDNDGFADYYDINDLVDLSLEINLHKFKVTGKVDILSWAQVYFDIYIDDEKVKTLNNNGRFWSVLLNQEKVISHEPIVYDIPDNTKNRYTDIEIIMKDFDFFKTNDVIDINSEIDEETLTLYFDNVANSIEQDGIASGFTGKLWYDISKSETDISEEETYNRTYRWNFDNNHWKYSLEIPIELYNEYEQADVRRSPQTENDMKKFITPNDEMVNKLKNWFKSISEKESYSSVKTVNFILRFVQENVKYVLDNISKEIQEYWRFPVESLVDKQGDCEDSSVLFASLLDALGYDVVLLLYYWKVDGKKLGHMAVGVHLDGDHGSFIRDETGKKYFYCETTTISYVVGKLPPKPPEIHGDPNKIIHI